MSILILPSRNIVQPQYPIKVNEEYLPYLDSCRQWNIPATHAHESGGSLFLPYAKTGTIADNVVTYSGIGVQGDGLTGYYSRGISQVATTGWIAATFVVKTVSSARKTIVSINTAVDVGGIMCVNNGLGTGNPISVQFRGNNGSAQISKICSSAPTIGKMYTVVGVFPSTAKADAYLYVNGIKSTLDNVNSANTSLTAPPTYTSELIGAAMSGASATTYSSDIIFWTARGSRLMPESMARALSADPWKIFAQKRRRLWVVPAGGGAGLAGDAADIASATGNLSTNIELAAVANALSTAVAGLSSGIPLSGNPIAIATASGTLSTTPSTLAGAAVSVATASGVLSTQIPLTGGAAALASSGGVLSAQILLSGAALSQALASAGLSSLIKLAGSAADMAISTADLTAGDNSSLAGNAQAQASASASLTVQIKLSGAAVAQALAQGGLSSGIELSGNAAAQASASSDLSTSIPLLGNAQAYAAAGGNLSTVINLSGASVSVAAATGDLAVGFTLSGAALAQALATGELFTAIQLSVDSFAAATAAATLILGNGYSIPTGVLRIASLTTRRRIAGATPRHQIRSLTSAN
jgi:hypothetical protein